MTARHYCLRCDHSADVQPGNTTCPECGEDMGKPVEERRSIRQRIMEMFGPLPDGRMTGQRHPPGMAPPVRVTRRHLDAINRALSAKGER